MNKLKLSLLLTALLTLGGCTPQMLGVMLGHVPGDTIAVVSRAPTYTTYVYTHTYPEELPLVSQLADRWCQQYQKRAVLIQNVQNNMDRSTASFSCM